jgi:hypothetical protein
MARRMFGGGTTADKDLRVGSAAAGRMRPGVLQMLFPGGAAKPMASADLRMGRSEGIRPGTRQMLGRGGRALADEDLRTGRDRNEPDDEQPLALGGEVDDDLGVDVSDDLVIAAEDIMDALQGGYFGSSPSESDSKVERASKEAAKEARAKILAQALKAFFTICESEPHGERDRD